MTDGLQNNSVVKMLTSKGLKLASFICTRGCHPIGTVLESATMVKVKDQRTRLVLPGRAAGQYSTSK